MLVGGALVNALAFSGSNFLFSSLRSGSAEERERHDRAIEQLQDAQVKWSKKRTDRIDWINEEFRRQGHAIQSFHDVNVAIREYAKEFPNNKNITLAPEPKLSDFYTPSDAQKDIEITFIILGMAATGLVGYYIAK